MRKFSSPNPPETEPYMNTTNKEEPQINFIKNIENKDNTNEIHPYISEEANITNNVTNATNPAAEGVIESNINVIKEVLEDIE